MAEQQPSGRQPSPSTAALVAAQSAALAALRARIVAAVQRIWAALPDYRAPEQFVTAVVPIVQAGQRQTAAITAAYLSQMYAILTGEPVKMIGVPQDKVTDLRGGVDPAEVYARPLHEVWRQLADLPHEPGAVERAIQAGLTRAENLATTDLQLAKQHAALHVLGHQDKVTGYRRVLEGTYSCGLCIVASTRRYHKAELLPIHPGCDCSVAEVVGDHDPGVLINAPALADVHDAIAQTFGKDSAAAGVIPGAKGGKGKPISYRDVIVTHEHGEIGPVLAVRGQTFTGPADIARHSTPERSKTS